MGATMDDISQKNSVWSEVPPSPRAANEKLIWKSNLHEKNKVTRGQNCAVGRLGQYTVGDPDIVYRLDDKMKAATHRGPPLMQVGHKTSNSFDVTQLLKRSGRNKKPGTLEPLPQMMETNSGLDDIKNSDIAYSAKKPSYGALAKNANGNFVSRHGSQVVNRTVQAVMPQAGGQAVGHKRNNSQTQS